MASRRQVARLTEPRLLWNLQKDGGLNGAYLPWMELGLTQA